MEQKFFTTKELTKRLPWLTEKAIRNLVARRKIPFRKPGGRLVFLNAEIEQWIEDAPGVTLDEVRGSDE